jgi:hypothetical protein
MTEQRKKKPMFTTPKLPLKWPKLDKVDYGTKEHPKPDGQYVTKMVAQADDPVVKAFLRQIEPAYREAIAQAEEEFKKLKVETRKKLGKITINDLFTTLYDKDTEEPTGEIEFKFAMKASGKRKDGTKWSAKPAVYDAKGKVMTVVPEIWSGSIAKVSFEAVPYFIPGTGAAGLSLKLKAVQIIEMRQGGARAAKDFGFGEEDGYEYDEADAQATEDGFKDESGSSTVDDDEVPF